VLYTSVMHYAVMHTTSVMHYLLLHL